MLQQALQNLSIEAELNSMRNLMVLQASSILNALQDEPTKIQAGNFSKKRTTLPKGMLIGVMADLQEVIVHLNQAADIPSERGKSKTCLSETRFKT